MLVRRRRIPLDPNRTIWQRIQQQLEPELGRAEADRLAGVLLPYIVAERDHASQRAIAWTHDQLQDRS